MSQSLLQTNNWILEILNAILTEEGPDLICLMWLQFIVDTEKNSDFAWYMYLKTVDQAFKIHFLHLARADCPRKKIELL